MCTILNKYDFVFTPGEEQVICNAAADYGIDTVYTSKSPTDGNNDTLYNFFDDATGDYVFSIDRATESIYSI